MAARRERKEKYVEKLNVLLQEYKNVLIVQVDNVGSRQMAMVRKDLRGKAVVVMGKNTLIRKVLRENAETTPKLAALLDYVVGNVGFIFTNWNLNEVRTIVTSHKVPAPAKSGSIAPRDVSIPAGPTGLDPAQTSFFQILNIATKIVKGSIEIVNETVVVKTGDKVSSSHVALLDKLNIRPFQYGFVVSDVYEDGAVYSAAILDMSQDDLMAKFMNGVSRVTALSLALGYPTEPAVPHMLGGAVRKLIAISLVTDYTFDLAKKFKDILENPEAFAALAAAAAAPAAGGAAAAAAPVQEEPKEESDADMGFSLFD